MMKMKKIGKVFLLPLLSLLLFSLCACGTSDELLNDLIVVRQTVEEAGYVNGNFEEFKRTDTGIFPYVMDYNYIYLSNDGKQTVLSIVPHLISDGVTECYSVVIYYNASICKRETDSHAIISFDSLKSLEVWREADSQNLWQVKENE